MSVAAATTDSESAKPGAPDGNIMIAPITNATMPPMPITPKEPMCASATMRPMPSSTRACAGIVDGQQVERVKRDQEADAPDQSRSHRSRIEKLEDQSVDPDEHQNESDVGIGDDGEQLGPPIRPCGHDLEIRGCQAFGLAADVDAAAIDLAEQIRHVVGDHVDDVKLERLGCRKAYRRANRFGRPIGVAAVELGEAADIGDRVVDGLAALRIRRLAGIATPLPALLFILLASGLVARREGPAFRPSESGWRRRDWCPEPWRRSRSHRRCRCRRSPRARRSGPRR